ncbi:ATP-binding protein [Asticcacaulis solisilvae]|uniref:ATP-binding protein n=1 Tax=Asticcacaulis solisilvae TaxID=1217274 RepID=UPI003FD87F81
MKRFLRPSLATQILKGIALPFLLVTVLIGVIAWISASDEISEIYDSNLTTTAQELWLLSHADNGGSRLSIDPRAMHMTPDDQDALDDYARWRRFRVWKGHALLIASDNSPPPNSGRYPRGFTTIRLNGETWRVYTMRSPGDDTTVEVSEKFEARSEVSGKIVWGVTLPLLFVLPIIGLLVWLGVRWGLRDLRGFASGVGERTPEDLSPIDEAVPVELTPLSRALNQLLAKLQHSLAQERLFTDNAAHELRTPLAALGVQAEVARNAGPGPERERLLDALSDGVQRTSALLDQLLTLARLQHATAEAVPVTLEEVVADAIRTAYPKARDRRIELSLSGEADITFRTRRAMVALLLGNLLDNAIKYAPEGSAVEVAIGVEDGRPAVTVRDHGPGIPEAERDAVFTRFYRGKGRTEPGSGLGLAIVRTICDILPADIALETPGDGTGVSAKVRFR